MSLKRAGTVLSGIKDNSYAALLQDSRWTQFAANIRQARGHACEICKRGNVELHVHHFGYSPEKKPWEYDAEEVALLCRGCHEQMHDELKRFRKFVFHKLTPRSFQVLNGALAVALDNHDTLQFAYAVAELAASPGSVKRFCEAFNAIKS